MGGVEGGLGFDPGGGANLGHVGCTTVSPHIVWETLARKHSKFRTHGLPKGLESALGGSCSSWGCLGGSWGVRVIRSGIVLRATLLVSMFLGRNLFMHLLASKALS